VKTQLIKDWPYFAQKIFYNIWEKRDLTDAHHYYY